MDVTSTYRLSDVYLTSGLSIIFVSVFVYLKSGDRWLEQRWFQFLLAAWTVLESAALVLCIVYDSGETELLPALKNSIHLILATLSMCGVANIQVSPNLQPLLAFF
jgi:hypothetical protein